MFGITVASITGCPTLARRTSLVPMLRILVKSQQGFANSCTNMHARTNPWINQNKDPPSRIPPSWAVIPELGSSTMRPDRRSGRSSLFEPHHFPEPIQQQHPVMSVQADDLGNNSWVVCFFGSPCVVRLGDTRVAQTWLVPSMDGERLASSTLKVPPSVIPSTAGPGY